MIRILVTGSRTWTDDTLLFRTLDNLVSMVCAHRPVLPIEITIVHGACPTGADAMATVWADLHRYVVERHPADRDRYGKRAGPLRNYAMVEAGADFCAAFPLEWPSGTEDCYRKAIRAGIPTLVTPESERESLRSQDTRRSHRRGTGGQRGEVRHAAGKRKAAK